jgi:hypothetical protein
MEERETTKELRGVDPTIYTLSYVCTAGSIPTLSEDRNSLRDSIPV